MSSPHTPSSKVMFEMLDPIMFPVTIVPAPAKPALMLTAISGRDVPIAAMVRPMKSSEMWSSFATPFSPLIETSVANNVPMIATVKMSRSLANICFF